MCLIVMINIRGTKWKRSSQVWSNLSSYCLKYFTTAKISFTSIPYLQFTHMIFIIYIHFTWNSNHCFDLPFTVRVTNFLILLFLLNRTSHLKWSVSSGVLGTAAFLIISTSVTIKPTLCSCTWSDATGRKSLFFCFLYHFKVMLFPYGFDVHVKFAFPPAVINSLSGSALRLGSLPSGKNKQQQQQQQQQQQHDISTKIWIDIHNAIIDSTWILLSRLFHIKPYSIH